jgi:CRP-like cAMP-binding protein
MRASMTMALRDHRIFKGIEPAALDWLDRQAERRSFPPDAVLIRQGEVGEQVYLILEGEVVLYREDGEVRLELGVLKAGDYFGELAAISGQPRTATAVALTAVSVALLPLPSPDTLDANSPAAAILSRASLNHIQEQGRRLVEANERTLASLRAQLHQAQARSQLSLAMIVILALVSLYSYLVGTIDSMTGIRMLLTSLGVALGSAVGAALFIQQSQASWETFGLSLRGIGPALRSALRWSVGMCVGITAVKWLLCQLIDPWSSLPLLSPEPIGPLRWLWVYLVSCLVQEFAARSFLHTALEQLLSGAHRQRWAILLSNLIFSVFHLHYSVVFALLTFLSGLVYGSWWRHHRSLLAVTVLHFITGVWAMDVLGLFSLPGFR